MGRRQGSSEQDKIDETILRLASVRGPEKTICPSEVARDIGGDDPRRWRPLMPIVRERAVTAANEGHIVIMQGGKPVDPEDLTGIYRIAISRK